VKKALTGVVALVLFAGGCGGSSESEELAQTRAELAQTRAELDALKEQIAGRVGLMGTHQTPTTLATVHTLLTPGMEGFTETFEEFMTDAERREWIRANPLIGLPWRDAEKIARDAGWSIKVIFAVEGVPVELTSDLALHRLRLIVVGGEEAGTVVDVVNA
tara:strand:+ start:2237 stop:2719 length:483 start_codon:yes stop_codon:yes gene_type:complete